MRELTRKIKVFRYHELDEDSKQRAYVEEYRRADAASQYDEGFRFVEEEDFERFAENQRMEFLASGLLFQSAEAIVWPKHIEWLAVVTLRRFRGDSFEIYKTLDALDETRFCLVYNDFWFGVYFKKGELKMLSMHREVFDIDEENERWEGLLKDNKRLYAELIRLEPEGEYESLIKWLKEFQFNQEQI